MIVIGVTVWDGSWKYLTPFLHALRDLDYPKNEIGVVFGESFVEEKTERVKRELEGEPYRFLKFLHEPICEWRALSLARAINKIREEALSHTETTHLLSLECDNPPPPHLLKRLLQINTEETPITTGVYARRGTRDPMIMKWRSPEDPYNDNENESYWKLYNRGGIVEVDKTGIGCMLIRRSVLQRHPFLDPLGTCSSDTTTCVKWRKEGLKILCDTRIRVPHLAEEIRLNIGCGRNRLWDYVNIDGDPAQHPDMIVDVAKQQLPFNDYTIERIESHHFLEHLSRDEFALHLWDCFRVLKKGGVIMAETPDLEYVCKYYLDHPEDPWAIAMLFGGQEAPYLFHRNGWSKKTLGKAFEGKGFRDVDVRNVNTYNQQSILLTAIK